MSLLSTQTTLKWIQNVYFEQGAKNLELRIGDVSISFNLLCLDDQVILLNDQTRVAEIISYTLFVLNYLGAR